MMATEGPVLVSVIGRLPHPTENLASFSVAFAIALIVEAPVMMLLSAGAAVGSDRLRYERLWHFTTAMALPLSCLMAIIGIPAVFNRLNEAIWHLPGELAHRVARAVWLLIPWPAAIGYRRLWQGILIRAGRSRIVAWGTVIRLIGMGIGAIFGVKVLLWEGSWCAALALSTGVVAEMLAIRLWADPTLRRLPYHETHPLSYASIAAFYSPLLLTSLLNVALTPLLTFLIAQGHAPILSLAAYSPTTSTIFLLSCVGVAYQEVVIVLMGTQAEKGLLPFAHRIASFTTAGLALFALPGIYDQWFGTVFALPSEVLPLAQLGLLYAIPMPALITYLAYLKGRFIWAHRTRMNLLAAMVEILLVLLISGVLILGTPLPALHGALLGLLLARVGTALILAAQPLKSQT